MKAYLLVTVVALAACKKDSSDSCAARVKAMEARLASPRPVAEMRKDASPALAADLDAILAAPDSASRATIAAERLEKAVFGCADVVRVFGEIAAVEGDKGDYLREKFPPAVEACACKASPEHAGVLVESILGEWR